MSNKNKSKRPKSSFDFKQNADRVVIEKGDRQHKTADHLGALLSDMRR